ncbi:acetylglutamate kinase [Enterococcus hulanensis]|uniref:Acetylglutamate kinase n=1 Tax=Enterococcus hulanensis TaxID=2559929 RepID=A0ABU3EXY9_9ENTE|nr:acetylglutamate kinase [Enterococcus hulanensis]MDT2599740.1 acetylglutamate kinase [Enterococcus hulanensis]MDT2609404.1 acetylglutamate kinase [Enterococcus hulanensis]MDT2615981.1 acetylglutamate kinase [Enterococcus hulanensis]MDT2627979.1 acetylglutamate kinase [Enterococcus hulanensis]MDT2655084.1 acetylglutamate kinase [Enterococcus hulanensis]
MGKIVVKIGGVASDNLTQSFFQQIEEWQTAGHEIIVVHGGGYYITEMMERLNIPVTIKEGLRVTTEQALKITQMVLIGQVQPTITTLFQQQGFATIGLNASSDNMIQGKFIDQEKLGYVGEITEVNPAAIEGVLYRNYIPIIAPLGMTSSGQWLNVNADDTACKIAEEVGAEALYLLTDVPGVKQAGEWLKKLSIAEVEELKNEEVITGGMIPKINSAINALENGVSEVHITNCIEKAGTVITKEEVFA